LHAAVAEEAFAGANQLHQRLRQASLRFVIVEVRTVDQPFRLLGESLCNRRVAVPERTDGNAASEVEVAFAGNVVKIAASPVAQDDVKSAIARDDILLK